MWGFKKNVGFFQAPTISQISESSEAEAMEATESKGREALVNCNCEVHITHPTPRSTQEMTCQEDETEDFQGGASDNKSYVLRNHRRRKGMKRSQGRGSSKSSGIWCFLRCMSFLNYLFPTIHCILCYSVVLKKILFCSQTLCWDRGCYNNYVPEIASLAFWARYHLP